MSIRKKIIYGYAASLGVALVGTGIGLWVGDQYQQSAQKIRQQASRERQLINALQVDILYNRPAKQLTPHVQNPEVFAKETSSLLKRIDNIQSKLEAHNQSGQPSQLEGLQPLLDEYEQTVKKFGAKVKTFIAQTQPLTASPTGGDQAQKQVVSLVKSSEFVGFIEFPDKLADYAILAEERESESEEGLQTAEEWRKLIILATLGLSVAVAALLAIYISRAIANPISSVTNVAQQVTRESNFDLSVPVQNEDEIGLLARSFNNLIERVRKLISEQKAYTEKLEEAKVAADSANHAKSEFLANMSHELRTPLNGILGYAQFLSQSSLSDQQNRGVGVIHQCGTHLLTLINDILDLAKIEARQMEIYPAPMYLPSLLEGISELTRIKAEHKQIKFISDIPSDIPAGISADEKRLRQVLLNLLGNAVKFTDDGSVTFSVRAENLPATSPELQERDEHEAYIKLSFDIKDTGVGMSEEQIEKIFQPFQQVGDNKKKAEGTGLGLAITHNILELMGTQVSITSEIGQGSTFHFDVITPLAKDWVGSNTETSRGKIIGYESDRHRILVVDDRWENRSVLSNLLSPIGFDIDEAENGKEAIEKLEAHAPSLIITDLSMPVMDGWEFLKYICENPSCQGIKVIVSSASVFAADRQKSFAAGGHDFLPKPIEVKELYRMLSQHLRLTWIYQEKKEAVPSQLQPQTIEEITPSQIPPAEHLEPLLEIAMQGDISGLKASLRTLSSQTRKYEPFYEQLQQLVTTFKINQVRETLKEALQKQ